MSNVEFHSRGAFDTTWDIYYQEPERLRRVGTIARRQSRYFFSLIGGTDLKDADTLSDIKKQVRQFFGS